MKNFLILFFLIYCNNFEFVGANFKFGENNYNLSNFFNFVSPTNAQSISREHQNLVCKKLRMADFNNDKTVDEADYSLLYLVAMKDHNALEQVHANPKLEELMDLTVQKLQDLKIRNRLLAANRHLVDDQDVTLFYNYLTNNIPFCPYKN